MAAITSINWKRTFSMENQDILICDICTHKYDYETRMPKFLSCHHTVCEQCLLTVAGDQVNIICPTCRQITRLGDNGVKGLQSNFYIIRIKETMDKIGSPKMKGCSKHSQQPMSFFCEKCSVSICRDCTVIDHKERVGHNIKDISDAEKEQRETLLQQLQASKVSQQQLELKVKQLEIETHNLNTVKDKAQRDIMDAFNKYQIILDTRKQEVITTLDKMYEARKHKLDGDIRELHEQVTSLQDSIKVTTESTPKGTLLEVVTMKTKLAVMAQSLTEYANTIMIDPNYIQFEDNAGLNKFQQCTDKLGTFNVDKMLPSKIKWFNTGKIFACLPATIKMKAFDYKDIPLFGYSLKVMIIDPERKVLPVNMSENPAHKDYNVTFTPEMSGKHKLLAKFHGQHFKGSEMILEVSSNNPVATIGSHGKGQGQFNGPRSVSIDSKNNLYVADTGNRLVQKFNAYGQFESQFSINDKQDNLSTCDLALDESNKAIICTETLLGQNMQPTMGNSVATYELNGKWKNRFCNKIMKCALCVATNTNGDIIISDYLVHSLFMYDKNGVFLRRISSPSDGFNHPAFICCDSESNIIVSDTNNDTIQVFNSQGQFKYQFGKSGSHKGQLKQPFGVATNGKEIVVVDSGNKRVQIFSNSGEFKGMIESKDYPFDQPRGLAISQDSCIFVADRNNHCIKKYEYKF